MSQCWLFYIPRLFQFQTFSLIWQLISHNFIAELHIKARDFWISPFLFQIDTAIHTHLFVRIFAWIAFHCDNILCKIWCIHSRDCNCYHWTSIVSCHWILSLPHWVNLCLHNRSRWLHWPVFYVVLLHQRVRVN